MSNTNVVVLQGNLTRDPETFGKEDNKVAKFTIAVNTGYGERKSTAFIDCVAFGGQVGTIMTFLKKGSQIIVNGSLQQQTWEKDGNKRSKIEVKVNNFSFAGRKESQTAEVETSAAQPEEKPLF